LTPLVDYLHASLLVLLYGVCLTALGEETKDEIQHMQRRLPSKSVFFDANFVFAKKKEVKV